MTEPVLISKEEAAAAATAAAFTITDEDASDYGRTILHCFIGSLGADWDLDGVLREIEESAECGWVDNLFGHDLTVISGDRNHAYSFDAERPKAAS